MGKDVFASDQCLHIMARCAHYINDLYHSYSRVIAKVIFNIQITEVVVSNNATSFTSNEFEAFMQANGVKPSIPPLFQWISGACSADAKRRTKEAQKWIIGNQALQISIFAIVPCLIAVLDHHQLS